MIEPRIISAEEEQATRFFAEGNFDQAEILFGRVALAQPNDAVAQYNWGVALGKCDQIEDALACYRKALTLEPHFADAYINMGSCLNEMNKVELARQGFALARQIAPDNPIPVINESIAALGLGDYENGWRDFAARWRLPAYEKFKRVFPQPAWQGESLEGKILLLYAEQGFGDTLQMARYVPLLVARGAKIIVESPPATVRILQSLKCDAQIITKGDALPAFDFHCALMDVPGLYGTRIDTIPALAPYLFASEDDVQFFRASANKEGKKRVGISWAGRQSHENDRNRSLKFTQLAPLLTRGDIEWVSLQRIVPDYDAAALAASSVVTCVERLNDFAATAALIMTLDIIITVDTAVAHLAGALGKEVWVLLPFFADWRWLMHRADSPWYPTAKLFRQEKRREWEKTISQIAALL